MKILALILFGLIVLIIKIINSPLPYSNVNIKSIGRLFNTIKYRGIANDSLIQNATMSVIEPHTGNVVGLIKYNEKGVEGLYFGVTVSNLLGKEKNFIEQIKSMGLQYFKKEGGIFKEIHYFIDIKFSLENFKDILKYVWKEIYESELVFEIYFQNNVSKPSSKVVNYITLKKPKSGLNINIPLTKLEWILYKIRGEKPLFK